MPEPACSAWAPVMPTTRTRVDREVARSLLMDCLRVERWLRLWPRGCAPLGRPFVAAGLGRSTERARTTPQPQASTSGCGMLRKVQSCRWLTHQRTCVTFGNAVEPFQTEAIGGRVSGQTLAPSSLEGRTGRQPTALW